MYKTKHGVSPIAYIHKSVLKNAPLPQRLATAPAIILADAGSVESRANAPSISTAPPFKMCACKQNKHDVSQSNRPYIPKLKKLAWFASAIARLAKAPAATRRVCK